MPPSLVPESKFYPIPQSKFVINSAKIILHDMLSGADGFCDFTVLESLGDKLDDSPFPFVGNPFSVSLSSKHSCLRYKVVASLTRLIPLRIPKRWKRRLKCALTVRRAILSCEAISRLSQPCNSNSAICRSRGPKRTDSSSMSTLPQG